MDSKENVGGRDRLLRAALAVVLSIVSVRWLKSGKRKRGLLAGVGALTLGFNATTGYCGVNESLGVDTTAEDDEDDPFAVDEADDDATEVDVDFTTADDTDAQSVNARSNGALTCAVCDDPIVPGQRRGPNDEGVIVHDNCE